MSAHVIDRSHVKQWVVNNAAVNNPYKREKWTAAVTIGYDYYGEGNTIEAAYNDMTDQIMKDPNIMYHLAQVESFKKIVKGKE